MSKSQGQHRRAVGRDRPPRRRRVPLVLLHHQAAVGRLPVLGRDGRRVACASSCCSSGTRTASTSSTRTPTTSTARAASRRPTSTAGRSRRLYGDRRDGHRALERYDATTAGRAIAAFVDELSNWYVRRSRRRFWDGDPAAFGTLHTCLVTVAKLLAPFTPVRRRRDLRQPRRLRAERPPDRLPAWPASATRRSSARWPSRARRWSSGCAARAQAKIKVRQPLRAAVVVAAGAERGAHRAPRRRRARRAQRQGAALRRRADELGSYEVKPNYRALGPRFGKRMPQVAAAVAALDPAHVAAALREGRTVGVNVDGHDHELGPERPAARDAAARGLPGRARGLARRGARARARRRAAPRGARARGRPRGPERAQGRRPARSRTGSRSRSTATRSCSPPRASTRTTSPARCWRRRWPRRRRRRRPRIDGRRLDRGRRAKRLTGAGSIWASRL